MKIRKHITQVKFPVLPSAKLYEIRRMSGQGVDICATPIPTPIFSFSAFSTSKACSNKLKTSQKPSEDCVVNFYDIEPLL